MRSLRLGGLTPPIAHNAFSCRHPRQQATLECKSGLDNRMRLSEPSSVPRYLSSAAGKRTRVCQSQHDIEDGSKYRAPLADLEAPCGGLRRSPGSPRFRRRKHRPPLPNRLDWRCCNLQACFGSISGRVRYRCPVTGTESDITPSSSLAEQTTAGHPYINEPA